MHRITAIGLAVVVLTASTTLLAQTIERAPLGVYAGAVVCDNPAYDTVALVEFPFSLSRFQLQFEQLDSTDTAWYAQVYAEVVLYDSLGYDCSSANTTFSVRVPSREEVARRDCMLFDKLALWVFPGDYSARVTVVDVLNDNEGKFFLDNVRVDTLSSEYLAIGGLQLAYSIRPVDEGAPGVNQRLVRNGYYIISSPMGVFSVQDSTAYLYGEIYNLGFDSAHPGRFRIKYSAYGEEGSLFQGFGERLVEMRGESSVFAEALDVKGWPAGKYEVRVEVQEMTTEREAVAALPLRLITPQFLEFASSVTGTFDPYDSLSLRTKINLASYFLGPERTQTLSRLSREGKQNFLEQFWRESDEDPTTLIIENRLRAIELYRQANELYSTNVEKSNGWAADRGRILILYGPADEIDANTAPVYREPYEVWYYRSMREGKYFVFEDWSGNFDYRLVHSNVYGEVYNAAWEELLRQGLPDFGQ